MYVHDLHAADAVYHQNCSVNFHTNKQMPMAQLTITEDVKRPKFGWPRDNERTIAFLEVARYLDEKIRLVQGRHQSHPNNP